MGPTMPIQLGVTSSKWPINDWLAPGEEVTTVTYCPEPGRCDTLKLTDGTDVERATKRFGNPAPDCWRGNPCGSRPF